MSHRYRIVTAALTILTLASTALGQTPAHRGIVHPGAPRVRPGLTSDAVRHVMESHLSEVRTCYENALAHDATLHGDFAIHFVVDVHGAVTTSEVGHQTSPAITPVGQCVADAFRRWTFPTPTGGSPVEAYYPFVMVPQP